MKILIIYSTIGGNTELAVKKAEECFLVKNCKVEIRRVDVTDPSQMSEFSAVILASPTYGQGTVEDHFIPFLKAMQKVDVSQIPFAVIGLGDTKYYPEYLTESAGILEEAVRKSGAKTIVPSLRIGMPPLKFINRLVPNWVDKIITQLTQQ